MSEHSDWVRYIQKSNQWRVILNEVVFTAGGYEFYLLRYNDV
jgi:hypothetical protein